MRIEEKQEERKSKVRLVGAVMGLALVAGVLLSMGSAPSAHATPSIEAAKPEAAETAFTPDSNPPDAPILELQLD
jgi:hypothetical protein